MEYFSGVVPGSNLLTIFAKSSTLDVWEGSEYASVVLVLVDGHSFLKIISEFQYLLWHHCYSALIDQRFYFENSLKQDFIKKTEHRLFLTKKLEFKFH